VWIRNPVANGFSYFVHFLLLSYICVSWALLVPMVVPPENVVLVIGFFVAFFGLLFSGAFPPIMYPGMSRKSLCERPVG
jgi:putative exporter of polyketide antibiotics